VRSRQRIRSHRKRRPQPAKLELVAEQEDEVEELSYDEEQRRRDFEELLALARQPLVAAIDPPLRPGGTDWHEDEPDLIPETIPEDRSPLDLARETWLRRERRRREAMPPADGPTLPESSKQEGDGVFYDEQTKTTTVIQRGLAAAAMAEFERRVPRPKAAVPNRVVPVAAGAAIRSDRPALAASGRPASAVPERGAGRGRRVTVHRGRTPAGSRPVSQIVAAAPPALEPTPADRLVAALETFLGRETPPPQITVNVPPTEPPTVNVRPIVRVDVPPPPKLRGVRVETDSHGRRHYVPIETEDEQ
jgi:hypothetical protein